MKENFAASPAALLKDGRITSGRVIAVYLALQYHVNGKSGTCFPGMDRLAELSHNSVKTTYRAIQELIELGYLEKNARPGTSNFYDVRWSVNMTEGVGQYDRGGSVNMTDEEEPVEEEPVKKEPLSSDTSNVSRELQDATELAQDFLGAEPVEEEKEDLSSETPQTKAPSPNTGEHNRHRAVALEKAQTPKPIGLWPTFDPENAGYTRKDFNREFPELDWDSTVSGFLAMHLGGKPKTNWMAEFFAYASRGHAMAKQRKADRVGSTGYETDSMGLPLDSQRRRVGDTPEAREARRAQYEKTEQHFRELEEKEATNEH